MLSSRPDSGAVDVAMVLKRPFCLIDWWRKLIRCRTVLMNFAHLFNSYKSLLGTFLQPLSSLRTEGFSFKELGDINSYNWYDSLGAYMYANKRQFQTFYREITVTTLIANHLKRKQKKSEKQTSKSYHMVLYVHD